MLSPSSKLSPQLSQTVNLLILYAQENNKPISEVLDETFTELRSNLNSQKTREFVKQSFVKS